MDNTTTRPSSAPPSPRPANQTHRGRTALRIVAIVVGSMMLLGGLGVAAGGGIMLAGQGIATDRDGFFEPPTERIESDGVAVVAADIDLDADTSDDEWFLNWLDVDVRLRVRAVGPSSDVFVGIARSADVARYLEGVSYSDLTDFDGDGPRYDNVIGTTLIESPIDQDIWVQQSSGSNEQEMLWEPRSGQWSVVLMNTDGSADVAADVDAAVRSGAITPIGVTLLIIGTFTTLVALGLIVFAARARRTPGAPGSDASAQPVPPPTSAPAAPMPPPPAWPIVDPVPVTENDIENVTEEPVGDRSDGLVGSR